MTVTVATFSCYIGNVTIVYAKEDEERGTSV
jgi:hypothetical protein